MQIPVTYFQVSPNTFTTDFAISKKNPNFVGYFAVFRIR